MSNQDDIELRWIFAIIRQNILLIVGFTLAAAAIAFVVSTLTPPVYVATASLLVQPAQDTRSSEYNLIVAGERLALTLSQMIKGHPVLDAVITKLDIIDETPNELAKRIRVEPVKDTQLIRLSVKSSSPEQAALLANTIADQFTTHYRDFQSERYASSVKSIQDEVEAITDQMTDTRLKIQALDAQRISKDAELTRLEGLLSSFNASNREFQKDYQALQLTAAQLADNVSIVEEAKVLEEQSPSLNTATVTLLLSHTQDIGGPNYSTETYEKILVGRPVLEAVVTKSGVDMSPEILAKRIRVVSVPETQLLLLTVVDSDTSKAALLANTIAEEFILQVKTLQAKSYDASLAGLQDQMDNLGVLIEVTQTEIAEITKEKVQVDVELANLEGLLAVDRRDYEQLQADYEQVRLTVEKAWDSIVVAEPAPLPERPIQNRKQYVAIAAIIGAVIALGIIFLLEYLKDVVRTPEDASQILGMGTLGSIGHIREANNGLIVVNKTNSPVSEAFRVLANNIRFAGLNRPLKTVLVTSPHAQEGKTLIVGNLAAALAQRGFKVVAIDADLRLPRLHELYALDQGPGLTNSLLNGKGNENLKEAGVEGLKVLTSGDLPPNPADVVASPRMQKLLEVLAKGTDLVLIDCPPVLPVADAAILASLVDGVILVLMADKSRRKDVRDAAESLRRSGGHLVGVVLNDVPSPSYTYYRYSNDEQEEEKTQMLSWEKLLARVKQLLRPDRGEGDSKELATHPGLWRRSIIKATQLFKKQP